MDFNSLHQRFYDELCNQTGSYSYDLEVDRNSAELYRGGTGTHAIVSYYIEEGPVFVMDGGQHRTPEKAAQYVAKNYNL